MALRSELVQEVAADLITDASFFEPHHKSARVLAIAHLRRHRGYWVYR